MLATMNENRLFVAKKPPFISSNLFLQRTRRRYKAKTAGYSGTLDPFAKGVLVMAFGKYTKLFRFLNKSPKTYRATLWLGAFSETLDIERVKSIEETKPIDISLITEELNKLLELKSILPPKFSAKKIDGKKAYELARAGREFDIKPMDVEIYSVKLLNYSHPFLTFEATVSEGTYIRTLGQLFANSFGVDGALTYLERVSEGKFVFDNEKPLNPIDFIDLPEIFCTKSTQEILNGKKITRDELSTNENGVYILKFEQFFSIIQVQNEKIGYILNGIDIY